MEFLKAKIQQPITFISCGHFFSEDVWIHSKRIIDSFEIIIGVQGCVHIQQDDTKYDVLPGTVLLLMPGHNHFGYESSFGKTSFYWVHFVINEEYLIKNEKDILLETLRLEQNPYNRTNEFIYIPYIYSPNDIEKVNILFKELLHIVNTRYYTSYAADYLLTLILIELSEQNIQKIINSNKTEIKDCKFTKVIEWIRININKNLSVDEIAEKFNYNKDYLTRLFKKNLGISTKKYINSLKILKAKELLYQSDMSIKEIAYSLGFDDEKYFMKLFKEYENITPSQYRNLYYKTHLNNK